MNLKTHLIYVGGRQVKKADIVKLLEPIDFKIGKQVFIKPNLAISASPESGIVTDVGLIGSLVDFLREKGVDKIFVGEGPVMGHQASDVFAGTGYKALAHEKNLELVDLNTAERKNVKWHYGKISIPNIVLDSFYINVAKLKTHVQTTVSLSMKNQKGLLLPIDKKRFHRDWGLHQAIAHLAEVVKPDLAMVDGFIGLEGDGPLSGGKPKKLGVLAAGEDMVALDSTCCHVIGIDPNSVLHLKYAEENGVGVMIPKTSPMLKRFQVRSIFQRANEDFRKMGKLYSIRNPYACTACGDAIACAIEHIKSTPKLWPRLATVMAFRALVGGMILLSGKNASTKGLKGKRICIGECTKSLAQECELRFVPGCPPKPEDITSAMLE